MRIGCIPRMRRLVGAGLAAARGVVGKADGPLAAAMEKAGPEPMAAVRLYGWAEQAGISSGDGESGRS